MKKINLISFVISIFLISSCATSLEDVRVIFSQDDKEKDLATKFDIPEDVGNFSEEPREQSTEKKNETPKKIAVKKSVVKKAHIETQIKDQSPDSDYINPLGVTLPSDYPDEYKEYDKKAEELWKSFKPRYFPGEQSIVTVSYLGVIAGYITIESKNITKMNGQDVFHYYARLKSNDSYRYFYWLDDIVESFVGVKNFTPVKYELVQREKKQNVDDLQIFDTKKSMTYHWYKREKGGQVKQDKIEKMIPSLATDSFSALQFVRGLPLKKGDVYEFPVITRGKFWLLRVDVEGSDNIAVNGKKVDAIRVRAETNFPGVLKKSGDINFWYSQDDTRKLLKFQAKVKLGSIYGELVEYKEGKKAE